MSRGIALAPLAAILLLPFASGVLIAKPSTSDEEAVSRQCAFRPLQPAELPGTLQHLQQVLATNRTRAHTELVQADCLISIGRLLSATARYGEAAASFEQARDLLRPQVKGADAKFALVEYRLGTNLLNTGSPQDAIPVLLDSLAMRRQLFGENNIRTALAAGALGRAYLSGGDWVRAEPLLAQGAEAFRAHPEERDLVQVPLLLGVIRADQHRAAEAESLLELAWSYYQDNETATIAGEHSAVMLARIKFDRQDYAEARPLLDRADEGMAAADVTDHVMADWMRETILISEGHGSAARSYGEEVARLCSSPDASLGLMRLCSQLTAARSQN